MKIQTFSNWKWKTRMLPDFNFSIGKNLDWQKNEKLVQILQLKLQILNLYETRYLFKSIENFKSGYVLMSIMDTSGFNFWMIKFQIRTCPDSNSGRVQISIFQLKISNPFVGFQFWMCLDFNSRLHILSSDSWEMLKQSTTTMFFWIIMIFFSGQG